MNGERQRLRPWLESQVNSGRIPQLSWVDKEEKIFKVPWKHAGKPGFVLDRDAALFREWARHTGKYREGEQADPSTWKTRFRCAINKLPDIEEVKSKTDLDGEEPYRVFKFLPKGITKPEETEQIPNSPFSDCLSLSPSTSIKLEENICIDSFSGLDTGSHENDVDFMQQEIFDKFKLDDDYLQYDELDCSETSESTLIAGPFSSFLSEAMAMPNPLQDIFELMGMNPDAMELNIKIFYKGNLVDEKTLQNSVHGCRIHSGVDFTQTGLELQNLFGPMDVLQIQFPPADDPIMENVHRGFLLQWENNNIVATRYCRAHVYASGGCFGTTVQQLVRRQPTKVFDYEVFLAGLAECRLNNGPLPLYEVYFGFGQQPSSASTVDPTVPITVCLTHSTAKASISKMGNHEVNEVSAENEEDVLAIHLQRLVLQPHQQLLLPQQVLKPQ